MSLMNNVEAGMSWDSSIPPWKKELILKKRASARSVTSSHLPASSGSIARGSRTISGVSETLPAVRPKWIGNGGHSTVSTHTRGYIPEHFSKFKHKDSDALSSRYFHSDAVNRRRHKSVPDGGESHFRARMGEEHNEDSEGGQQSPAFSSYSEGFVYEENSEEYEYGPGIVDRLRSKFIHLSMTVREETQQRQVEFPMRRVASCEHLDEGVPKQDFRSKRKYGTVSAKLGANKKTRQLDVLKKAYSMETLTVIGKYSGEINDDENIPTSVLVNENVIIIEQNKTQRPLPSVAIVAPRDLVKRRGSATIEDNELPRPDTVRNYKKMFETTVECKLNGGQPGRPVSIAKPIQAGNKKPSAKIVSWVEEAAAKSLLKPTLNGSSPPRDHFDGKIIENGHKPVPNGGYNESKMDNEDSQNVNNMSGKIISKESLERIRAASEVSCFFGRKTQLQPTAKENLNENNALVNGSRPRIVDIKTKPEEKPVGMIKPLTVTVPVEQKENLINQAKTAMAKSNVGIGIPIVNGTINTNESNENGSKIMLKKPIAPATETNSVVFNFTDKTNVTPKITNTHRSVQRPVVKIDKTSGKLVSNIFQGSDASAIVFIPGVTACVSSDFEEDDEVGNPNDLIIPCGIVFEGENVIIGKSNLLQKRNKQLKICFDDSLTDMYEYPSEALVLESYVGENNENANNANDSSVIPDTSASPVTLGSSSLKTTPALSGSGGLGNYIPSKLTDAETFELGISPQPAKTPVPNSKPAQAPTEDELFLKPAEDDQASSWSSGHTAETDLLF